MKDNRRATPRSHAVREENAGQGFILWIGAFALLVLSLFAFNGAGAHAPSSGMVRETMQPSQAAMSPAVAMPGDQGTLGRRF